MLYTIELRRKEDDNLYNRHSDLLYNRAIYLLMIAPLSTEGISGYSYCNKSKRYRLNGKYVSKKTFVEYILDNGIKYVDRLGNKAYYSIKTIDNKYTWL